MRKIIPLLCLAFTFFAFGLGCPGSAMGADDSQFTDIEGWYKPYIEDLTGKDILTGRTGTTFCPEERITRAEFLAILFRLSGDDINDYRGITPSFNDVDDSAWYFPYVEWGYANKVVLGYANGTFLPNQAIGRQDIAVMLSRYARRVEGLKFPDKGKGVNFTDAEFIGSYAAESVYLLSRAGLLEGYANGTFVPKNPILRGETAKVISVFLEDSPEYESIGYTWRDLSYFIHAGGTVDGVSFTNTMEAFDNCVANNQRFIEVDFCWTKDDHLVCLRDWGYIDKTGSLSLEEFMSMKIFNGHTPASIDTLAQWLRENPDEYIITDVKEFNVKALRAIAEGYPDLINRFIPQIYGSAEYPAVSRLGYENIILTTYNMNWDDVIKAEKIISFAQDYDIIAIALNEFFYRDPLYIQELKGAGVLLAVFTVNESDAVASCRNIGADIVYTDRVDLR